MFRSHHLQRRTNGIYYFRFHVPTKLVARFNCREIVRSLKTRDRQEAERRLTFERVRVYRLIEMTRNLSELNQADLEGVAVRYFHAGSRRVEAERLATKIKDGEYQHKLAIRIDIIEMLQSDLKQNRFRHIADNIQEICDSEQIVNEPDTDNYRALGHLTLRAMIQMHELSYARTSGQYDAQPKDPLFLETSSEVVDANPANTPHEDQVFSVVTIKDKFLEHRKDGLAFHTLRNYKASLSVCCRILGEDAPIKEISKENTRALRDTLVKLPANFLKRHPTYSIAAMLRAAEEMNHPGMNPATVKYYLTCLSSMFKYAENEGYIDSNPVSGITVPDPIPGAAKRNPFDTTHLQAIFDAPTYKGMRSSNFWKQSGDVVERDAKYWLPVVALFTGMRLGELIALQSQHCLSEDGVFYFDIKEAKSHAGIRKVPFHPTLIQCGFHNYLDRITESNSVFGDLQGTPYSKHFKRFKNSVGISDPKLVFHSFRHTFTDALRRARVEEPLAKALLGHSEGSVTGRYGSGYHLSALSEAIDQIEYPDLILDHLLP
jgi:integrase